MNIPKKENPMAIRSKNALKGSMLKLLIDKEFSDISILDIVNDCGFSRQSFYGNFTRKEDVLYYALDQLFDEYLIQNNDEKSIPYQVINNYFIYWNKHKEILVILFKRNLGYLFLAKNRELFENELSGISKTITTDINQLPYNQVYFAGLSYELLRYWIINDNELSISGLSEIAKKLLNYKEDSKKKEVDANERKK